MAEKTIYGRSIQKHDTEANWLKATGFTPKQGEIIVYDIDATYNYERIKIGDGKTLVSSLPFVDDALRATILEQISAKVDKVDGKGLSTNDYTTAEKTKLSGIAEGANKTVVDTSLSTSSANPIENKAVATAINNLSGLVGDESVSTQISEAVSSKADTSALISHTNNKSNPHVVTKAQIGLGNVENKTATEILDELSVDNIESTLGYIPPSEEKIARGSNVIADGLLTTTALKNGIAKLAVVGKSYKSKNWLENVAGAATISGVTFTVNTDKSITVNGTATSDISYRVSANSPNLPDEDLIFSGCPNGGSANGYSLHYTNTVNNAYVDYGNGVPVYKFDYETYPYSQVIIIIKNGTVCNNLVFKPMIRLASETDDTYEPFGITSVGEDGSTEVEVCGNNLFDYEQWKTVYVSGGSTGVFENNGITITANANDAHTAYRPSEFKQKIAVSEGETITLSWESDAAENNIEGNVFIFANGASPYVYADARSHNSLSYTIPAGVDFITFRFGVQNAGDTISYQNIMFRREGDDTYKPYSGQSLALPITLNGIPVDEGGNYTDESGQMWLADKAEIQNGVVSVTRRVKKIVVDGSEDWGLSNQGAFYIRLPDAYIIDATNTETFKGCMSDRYISGTWTLATTGNVCCTLTWGSGVGVCDTNFATVDEFKAHLATNPLTMVYALAEPTTETYSIDQLVNQAGTLNIIQPEGAGLELTLSGAASSTAMKNSFVDASISGKTITLTKGDGATKTLTTQDTTYSVATTSAAGLMSASDKSKLDGIATGANKITVDTALSSTSTNPVQNKVVNTAISNLKTLVGDTAVSTQIDEAIAESKADWNQNDKTAPDYIKNKPFGREETVTYTQTGEVTGTANSNGVLSCNNMGMFSDTYRVTVNGEVYDNVTDSGGLNFYFGDYKYYASISEGMSFSFRQLTPGETYHIIVEKVTTETIVNKIDAEFLPDYDAALSETSTNAVQNKAVTVAINDLSTLIGDSPVADQITEAVNNIDGLLYLGDAVNSTAEVINADTLGGQLPEHYAVADTQGINPYAHSAGTLTGTGENGKFKATISETVSSINVNGTACSVNCGGENSVELVVDAWYTFILDGTTINFKSGGGLSNSKLALATASTSDVLSGKTFYSGNKELKTGTRNFGARGTFTSGSKNGVSVSVNLGFKPKVIVNMFIGSQTSVHCYDTTKSTTVYESWWSTGYTTKTNGEIEKYEITDDGFIYTVVNNNGAWNKTMYYFAY